METQISYLLDTPTMFLSSELTQRRLPPPFLFNSSLNKVLSVLKKKAEMGYEQKTYDLNYFVEIKVPKFTDDLFRQHFRLQRSTVQGLINFLGPQLNVNLPGRPKVAVTRQVLLSIWVLANQNSFRDIADRFDLERGVAHWVFIKFVNVIFNSRFQFIKFPEEEDLHIVAVGFQNLRNQFFPGTIGCVDGCEIPIPAPSTDKQSYYNRNKFHSVTLQGICDHRMIFIDVFAGWPGATHDARVWQNSPIYNLLSNGQLITPDQHLLGDSAYPIAPFIQVPFRNNGHLTLTQKNYNKIFSSSRVIIEQAFGLLKCRFRRLKYLNMSNLKYIAKVIVVCCVLHNVCILNNDVIDVDDLVLDDEEHFVPLHQWAATGNQKRIRISNELV